MMRGVRSAGATWGSARLREGLFSDLSNPKTVIVFTSVIPQFLNSSASPVDALILGLTFALIGFMSLAGYALRSARPQTCCAMLA
jgi:threonine/homoserine/homoserine lactone efflux protein